eukprot:TRINITY_DN11411_c0_g1_i1.p1 TRINITY_DN11411_c0_g1~~TRINITY_DN11411_c0_g1_i1.p1  ORF type:complete len:210 (-),score=13.58 TRINITY_DN11411_c0_g1_i1:11-640(-)
MRDLLRLSTTCKQFARLLLDSDFLIWRWKLDSLLGASASRLTGDLRKRQQAEGHSMTLRRFCTLIVIIEQLLRNAFTSCDWLALYDTGEVLLACGMLSTKYMLPMFQGLFGRYAPLLSHQAVHWAWELANGRAKPWSGSGRPTAQVVQLDSLRDWLHTHVTASVQAWHTVDAFSQVVVFLRRSKLPFDASDCHSVPLSSCWCSFCHCDS